MTAHAVSPEPLQELELLRALALGGPRNDIGEATSTRGSRAADRDPLDGLTTPALRRIGRDLNAPDPAARARGLHALSNLCAPLGLTVPTRPAMPGEPPAFLPQPAVSATTPPPRPPALTLSEAPGVAGVGRAALLANDAARRRASSGPPSDAGRQNADAEGAIAGGHTDAAALEEPVTRRTWTADELLGTAFPPPRWAIQDLLPVGLVLLAGKPKSMKGWLALQISRDVAAGRPAFGRATTAGPVLFYALEDSPGRLQSRLRLQRWSTGLPVTFAFTLPPLTGQRAAAVEVLADQVRVQRPRLVVVDTLGRLLAPGTDANRAADMTAALDGLQRLALHAGFSLLLIDHHRKGEGDDTVEQVAGSIAKGAVADAIWSLFRRRTEHRAVLKLTGRDLAEEYAFALDWEPAEGAWRWVGDAHDPRRSPLHRRLCEALERVGGSATTSDLARATATDVGLTSRALAGLVASDVVVRVGREGRTVVYRLAGRRVAGPALQDDGSDVALEAVELGGSA